MKSLEILNKIEEILKNNIQFKTSDSKKASETSIEETEVKKEKSSTKKGPLKEVLNLGVSFVMNLVKTPFEIASSYIKNEIVRVAKKELKLYLLIFIFLGMLFTIFIVFWVVLSLAFGTYLQSLGLSNLAAILYVLLFQVVAFLLVVLGIYLTIKKIKSIKMFQKPFKDYLEE